MFGIENEHLLYIVKQLAASRHVKITFDIPFPLSSMTNFVYEDFAKTD